MDYLERQIVNHRKKTYIWKYIWYLCKNALQFILNEILAIETTSNGCLEIDAFVRTVQLAIYEQANQTKANLKLRQDHLSTCFM